MNAAPAAVAAVHFVTPQRAGFAATLSERALAVAFITAAVIYLLTALCAIVNFAWQQPIFDQFRLYDVYLSLPFPDNVLQLENSHRPVLPALLRLVEIHWFGANQKLQIALGMSFSFAIALIMALLAARERTLSPAARAAGVFVAVIGVLWLANARMLLHGNEAMQVYLVALCTVVAALCCARAAQGHEGRWMALASLCCLVATFTFGNGIATFAAVIALGWLQRLRLKTLLLPVAVLALCLCLYLFALPGDAGVREQLAFRPLALAATASRWLASPWIVGWLGLGDEALYGWALDGLRAQALPAALIAAAETLQRWSGLRWTGSGATVVGATGIMAFALLLAPYLRRRERLRAYDSAALGLCLFALATAAVLCLGRLDYLEQFPMQTFADRYLLWPCLFWLGLGLLLLRRLAPRLQSLPRQLALLPLLAVAVLAWPTHHLWTGWGATVYRNLQQSAASARADAFDPRHFAENPAVTGETILSALQRLRARKLAMYADPGSDWLGRTLRGPLHPAAPISAVPITLEALHDLRNGAPIARFDGWIASGISAAQDAGELVVIDTNDRIVGFAEYSFIRPQAEVLRLDLPKKRGYDGYIRGYEAGATYRLALVHDPDQGGLLLYEFR